MKNDVPQTPGPEERRSLTVLYTSCTTPACPLRRPPPRPITPLDAPPARTRPRGRQRRFFPCAEPVEVGGGCAASSGGLVCPANGCLLCNLTRPRRGFAEQSAWTRRGRDV
eukprot:9486107-Pyramimonas_sp.AAC.1